MNNKFKVLDSGLSINKISKTYGAKCSFLRTNYFNDFSTTDQVVFDVLKNLKIKENLEFTEVFLLMPTCPNRTSEDLKKFNNYLKKESKKKTLNFASTIVEYPHFLNPTFSLFKKNDFHNADHLNDSGASKLSVIVNKFLSVNKYEQ